jgi:hypothetical protein
LIAVFGIMVLKQGNAFKLHLKTGRESMSIKSILFLNNPLFESQSN